MRSIFTLKRLLLAFSMIFALCTLACGFEDDEPEPEPTGKEQGESCQDHSECKSYNCVCVSEFYHICISDKVCD